MFESKISARATQKLPYFKNFSSRSYDMKVMQRNAWKNIANWRIKQTDSYTKSQHHALTTTNSTKKNGICWRIIKSLLTCCCKILYLARTGRPDILSSVNKLARAITKWTGACDRRSARLISYIHHTSDYRQYSHVGNTAQHCRLGLLQDPDFAGDFEDSKSIWERR